MDNHQAELLRADTPEASAVALIARVLRDRHGHRTLAELLDRLDIVYPRQEDLFGAVNEPDPTLDLDAGHRSATDAISEDWLVNAEILDLGALGLISPTRVIPIVASTAIGRCDQHHKPAAHTH